MFFKIHKSKYIKRILISLILSFILLASGFLLTNMISDHQKSKKYFILSRANIPGEFKLESLPEELSDAEHITLYLDSQLSSETAVISKNPFSGYFNYQFNLPVKIESETEGESKYIEKTFSSDNYKIFSKIQFEDHYNETFLLIPLLKFKNSFKTIKISFKEDHKYNSNWFQPTLTVSESSPFIYESYLISNLLIVLGIIIFPLTVLISIISYALRSLGNLSG